MSTSRTAFPAPADSAEVDHQALWLRLANADDSSDDFVRYWLACQCAELPNVVRAVLVLGAPDTGPFAPAAYWPGHEAPSALLAEAAELALQERQAVMRKGVPHCAVAHPVLVGGQLHGVVAVETLPQTDAALQAVSRRLQWGAAAIEALLLRRQKGDDRELLSRLTATLDLVAAALSEDGFEATANAVATSLALQLDCDRVSIGMRREQHMRVVALSHSAQFGKRMNLIRAIEQAMDEALDQKALVVLPAPAADTLVTRDHAVLAREHGSASVLTIPFAVEPSASGAFTFERAADRPFGHADVALCQAGVAICSRILEAKRLNERHLLARVKDSAQAELRRLVGPRHFGRKLAVLGLVASVLFFSVAHWQYQIGTSALVEGSVRRVLVAPFDGYVATSAFRAGDVVKGGSVIAALDERDLRLEYMKWMSQYEQYGKQYQDAVAQHDRAQSSIFLAQVQQAQAQIDLLQEQLARTSLAAPFDGVIVSGDLSQSIGSAVKRGQVLFEVSPLDNYRVVLEVAEADILELKAGQKGSLVLPALPGAVLGFTVSHLTPVTSSREGRSFFRVEATLDQRGDTLRPGMEGVGKIALGQRKLIWIWTHKMVDWLSLQLWTWL